MGLPDQQVTASSIMPGQIRDEQPHGYWITRPPPAPVSKLNRPAHHDRAFGPVAAKEPETIAGPHRTLLNEPGGNGTAVGEHEDIVNPEPEPVRRLAAHACILSGNVAAPALCLSRAFSPQVFRQGWRIAHQAAALDRVAGRYPSGGTTISISPVSTSYTRPDTRRVGGSVPRAMSTSIRTAAYGSPTALPSRSAAGISKYSASCSG